MSGDFYETIPALGNFADAVRAENYRPLPDDWLVGFADVVGSTKAVADGRYKAVNMAGAGAIAAVANALDRRPFPFVFGGDGASFAVSSADAAAAARALQAMAAFAREEFHFDLRVAMAPVGEIRAAGYDVRVARFAAAPPCVYAMFAGGGLTWFDAARQARRLCFAARRRRRARPICPASPAAGAWRRRSNGRRFFADRRAAGRRRAICGAHRRDCDASSLALPSSERPVTLISLRPGNPAKAIALETAVRSRVGPGEGACAAFSQPTGIRGWQSSSALSLRGPASTLPRMRATRRQRRLSQV